MNKLIGLLVGCWLGFVPVAQAGYEEGWAAYDRGDYATALKEIKPLAEQGHTGAQWHLGLMYSNGRGVPQDYKEAEKWYRKSAEQGDATGQYFLAQMYYDGQGVPQDYEEAAKWYREAAERGVADARYKLGVAYRTGQGVPQNDVLALMWLSLAAHHGHQDAKEADDTLREIMTDDQITEARHLALEWKPKE